MNNINRILILKKGVHGDLSKCKLCKTNFTAIQPCIVCQSIIEKEQALGRKLSNKECADLTNGLLGGKDE